MPQPACSVIIRSYNEEKHLGRLLEGIAQQTVKDVEIILVDSGSTDGTLTVAARYPVQVVHIAPEEFTFGRSLNLGIQVASAELLVFASAHVYPVYPDWLEKMLAPFADPQIALVYGKQRGGQSSKYSERQIFASWYPDDAQQYQESPFCNNANAAVRRSLALEHPYNETLPGLEDLEWATRMMNAGYKIHYAPEAEIIHVHNETPRAVFNRYKREAIAFKHIYIHERFGFLDFVRLSARNIVRDMQNAAHDGELLRSFGSIIWFRLCQFWGTYQGYRYSGPLTWQLRQRFYYPNGVSQGNQPIERPVKPIDYHAIE
ncbi:MAG TPA: glycosyltransferase family A protein [Anaerolineaceae bacterium]|nr:glycosyltransferase family A protein [Anaerolineaceae bacterium]